MSENYANYQKFFSGYELVVTSFEELGELEPRIKNQGPSQLMLDEQYVYSMGFDQFFSDEYFPIALKEVRQALSSMTPEVLNQNLLGLSDPGTLLFNSILRSVPGYMSHVSVPVEWGSFFAPFMKEYFEHMGEIRPLAGRNHFQSLYFSFASKEFKEVPYERLQNFSSLKGDERYLDLAEIVSEQLYFMFSSKLAQSDFKMPENPLIALLPTWIVLLNTEFDDYDPKSPGVPGIIKNLPK